MGFPVSACATAVVLLLWCGASAAAEADGEPDPPGSWGVVPLPLLSYAPETELVLGGMAGGYVKSETPKTHDTTFLALAAISTKGQAIFGGGLDAHLLRDQMLVGVELMLRRFPDTFYGVGNDTPLSAAEDFSSDDFSYELRPMVRAANHLYFGVVKHVWFSRVREREPGGLLASDAVTGASGGRSMGVGVAGTYDSRDNTINATQGVYVLAKATTYRRELGSQFDFGAYLLDARTYLSPGPGHVIALNAFVDARSGDAPFYQLAQLGGRNKLRGHYEGRYRDELLGLIQTEYRFPIVGILSGVGFGGVGDVAEKVDDFLSHGLKYSAGGGARVLLDPKGRVNAAVDFGYAGDQTGLYVSLGEAF